MLSPATFFAGRPNGPKFSAEPSDGSGAAPLTKGLPAMRGPPPSVRAIPPTAAAPSRESSGTEPPSAGAPNGGIPPANSKWLCLLLHRLVVYFLRKRSARPPSPPAAGLSAPAFGLVAAGSGLAATGTAALVCVVALCSAGGPTA